MTRNQFRSANREHKNNAQDDLWVCAYLMKTFVKFTTGEPESRPSFLVGERTTLTLGPQEVLVTRGSESCKMYPKISRTSTAENFSGSDPWVILLFFRESRKRTSPWYYFISVDRALRRSTLFVLYGPRNLSTEVWWLKECHKDQNVQQIRTLIF